MAHAAEPHVEHVSVTPSAALRPYVDRFVGYRMSGFEPGVHAGLPSTSLTFIISFDDPLTLGVMPDPRQAPASMWSMVGGLHDSPAQIVHDGNQHGLQLDVTPLGARSLFGLPAGALAHSVVPLEHLLGFGAAELVDRLSCAPSWGARVAVLEAVLLGQLRQRQDRSGSTTRRELHWAWAQICTSAGSVRVDDVADEIGWSRRHFSSQFRSEFGLSPSTMSRVARFHRVRTLLQSAAPPSLSDAAVLGGYADQAHLTREFTRLAGSPPAAWLRDEEFPSVQDHLELSAGH